MSTNSISTNEMDIFEYIYKFSDDELIDDCIKTIIGNQQEKKYLSYFNLKKFIDTILISYDNNLNKVMTQLEKDFLRQKITLNNIWYKDIKLFCDHVGFLFEKCGITCGLSYQNIIYLLCCQSSFYFPFKILYSLYVDDKMENCIVCDSVHSRTSINISVKNVVTLELKTVLIEKNIEKNLKINRIDVTMTITLDPQDNLSNEKIGLFEWNIDRINDKSL